MHLSESDRGVPGSGNIDWRSVMTALKAANFSGDLVGDSFVNMMPQLAIALTGIGQGVYVAIDLVLAAAVLTEGGRQAGKDLGVFTIAEVLPFTVAPALAPLLLAIGGGGNYTALFLAAAVFAFVGALCIQPIKGVR